MERVRLIELLPGNSCDFKERLGQRSDQNALMDQSIMENEALKVLGLNETNSAQNKREKQQSIRTFASGGALSPTTSMWLCWEAQHLKKIREVSLPSSPSTIDLGLLWTTNAPSAAGSTAICAIDVPAYHSPLLPVLVNLLRADKASARAMYEETNMRRRQLLTGILTGDAAREDNPLRVDVRYISSSSQGQNEKSGAR
jgi:hypothetical protein